MASARPFELPPPPPPPNGAVLSLLAALSGAGGGPADGPDRHQAALKARDNALSSSPEGYGDLCAGFGRVLACPSPEAAPEDALIQLRGSDPGRFEECCGWMAHRGSSEHGGSEHGINAEFEARKARGLESWTALRQMAGLLLKNALVSPPLPKNAPLDALGRVVPGHGPMRMELPPHVAEEIKRGLLTCIADRRQAVRGAASTAVARCCASAVHLEKSMGAFAVKNWSELVPYLLSCVEAGNDAALVSAATSSVTTPEENEAACRLAEDAALGALNTLRKLIEDIPNRLANEAPSSSFHDLIPALLRSLGAHEEPRKIEALGCLSGLIAPLPGSLVARMDEYLAGLSSLASDPNPGVRRLVCRSIVALLERRSEYLKPHIASVGEFMLRATCDSDPDVALEACEFWLTYASLDEEAWEMAAAVGELIPRLLPQLLRGTVYPPEKVEELTELNALEEASATAGDRAEDLAPVFHRSRTKGQGDDSDDDSDDDDDDAFDDDHEWTLRKCSAASLDALAGTFGPQAVLPPLLPALQEGLGHADQWVREGSVLALGAIADGCGEDLAPHLPRLHPFLVGELTGPDRIPQLRCIAAWTLGRYASWAAEQTGTANNGGEGDASLVGRVAEALAGRMLDPHRRVQVATTSALGVLVETAGDLLVPYLEPVYGVLVRAMGRYGTRSRLVLFDTMGAMADQCGSAIGEGNLPGTYVPPLLRLWNDVATENPFDRTLLPLMECLGSSVVACGLNYQPWAMETFEMAS
ncbi:hypothetical protein ACHAWF_002487 [Thalassiosira exigua]